MSRRSLNAKLHDAYIGREVLLRRVTAGVVARLDAKVVELGYELAALARRIDPISPTTEMEKMRRRNTLDKEGTALIVRRMDEMRLALLSDCRQIGIYEASFVSQLLEEAMNGHI